MESMNCVWIVPRTMRMLNAHTGKPNTGYAQMEESAGPDSHSSSLLDLADPLRVEGNPSFVGCQR